MNILIRSTYKTVVKETEGHNGVNMTTELCVTFSIIIIYIYQLYLKKKAMSSEMVDVQKYKI